ncbi:MAG: glutathione S-transferase family protein [Aestuariivita sp.]|nr:glutathione S-transferase family protein [Aestuariivita sp.]MCY4201055.1 glutathione S-transferase family protein [Aestuariivita sp.]MCY4288445.1 glutathione S-transferase family protein [Aestuariivita sp.]MCY4347612.1 glutathione S-transferase family protein [Aestuariivita sp.]
MATPYVLYYAPDNASLIVRLALEELNVDYRSVLIDRRINAHLSDAYRKLNPAARIPTLETPDGPISETAAILLWLADRHGHLLPSINHKLRGAALNWLFFISNTIHAEMTILFYSDRYAPNSAIPALRKALKKRLNLHLEILEKQASPRLSSWLGGEIPSALDLYIAAIIRWLQIYPTPDGIGLNLTKIPRLRDICYRLESRPSVLAFCKAENIKQQPFTQPELPFTT